MTEPEGELEAATTDRWAVAALVCGWVGIFVAGAGMALVTARLAVGAGRRAREEGRSLEQAYLALGLAAADGVVWIALHLMFDIPWALG